MSASEPGGTRSDDGDEIVRVYVAATNLEANLLANLLSSEGIDARAAEDCSAVALISLGPMGPLHRPEVFVRRRDVPAARAFLEEYERRAAEEPETDADACWHCGDPCPTAATVCPCCGAALERDADEAEADRDDDSGEPTALDDLRSLRKFVSLLLLAPLFVAVGALLALLIGFALRLAGVRM